MVFLVNRGYYNNIGVTMLYVPVLLIVQALLNNLHQVQCCQSWFVAEPTYRLRAKQMTPYIEPHDGVWQPVANTELQFYVYSAFVERRMMYAVRIIAATNTYTPDKVICHLWLPSNRTVTIQASIQVIQDHEHLEFTAAFVLCPLRYSGVTADETVGAIVAVIAAKTPDEPTTNLLVVQDTAPKSNISGNLHVCVKPFYRYSRTQWVLEWLELNRLLGVSHFYLYNDSVSDRFGCLLKHYQNKSIVTLRQWQLPLKSDVDIKGNGVVAAFNDCLYRSMANADWLLVIDADEIVMPRYEKTIPDLLRSLSDEFVTKKPAAFNFTNAFFYVFWEDDPESPSPLMTSRKTQRLRTNEVDGKDQRLKTNENERENDDKRNKYAVRPQDTVEVGKNTVWELMPDTVAVKVPPKRAIMHHYRVNCENFDKHDCHEQPSVVDRTAHTWTEELYKIMRIRHEEIKCLQA